MSIDKELPKVRRSFVPLSSNFGSPRRLLGLLDLKSGHPRNPGSILGRSKRYIYFLNGSASHWSPSFLIFNEYRRNFTGFKTARAWIWPLTLSSVEGKNVWGSNFFLLICLNGMHRNNFIYDTKNQEFLILQQDRCDNQNNSRVVLILKTAGVSGKSALMWQLVVEKINFG